MNNFPRPVRKGAPPPPPPPQVRPPAVAPWVRPWPRVDATFVALVGLIITAFAMASAHGRYPSQLASTTAYGVLATLALSLCFEARGGLKNLVRPDLVGIAALYYLTLYEFLVPQPYFDNQMPDVRATYLALWAVVVGFIGIFIGRHLLPKGRQPFEEIMTRPVPGGWLIAMLWGSFFLGFLHVLLGAKWDLAEMWDAMLRARFDQPWGRGKFGDLKALIHELSLLLYLVPPIVGLMLGRRERFSALSLVPAVLALLWLLVFGFLSGTRTVFAAYLITFLIAFTFSSPAERRAQVVVVAVICGGLMMMATRVMLDMRPVGFRRWLAGDMPDMITRQNSAIFVDDNLLAIARLAQYFPDQNQGRYLGFEIPWLALVRPIPRVIWPGKPKGMSVAIEDVVDGKGATIAATFVGEAYMSGGLLAVAASGLLLGILTTFWNRFASPKNSELGLLVYSSGFFAVTITMRSCFSLTTAILPSIAGILFGKFVLPKIRTQLAPRRVPPPRKPAARHPARSPDAA